MTFPPLAELSNHQHHDLTTHRDRFSACCARCESRRYFRQPLHFVVCPNHILCSSLKFHNHVLSNKNENSCNPDNTTANLFCFRCTRSTVSCVPLPASPLPLTPTLFNHCSCHPALLLCHGSVTTAFAADNDHLYSDYHLTYRKLVATLFSHLVFH